MIAVCCNRGFNCQAGNVDLGKLRISAGAANGFARNALAPQGRQSWQ
jgi:hypothetical protein